MLPPPEKLTLAMRVHFLDQDFNKQKAHALRNILNQDYKEDLWYYQMELDITNIEQNKRLMVSNQFMEEIRRRYFRTNIFQERIQTNKFQSMSVRNVYHGEMTKKQLPDGIGTMHYQTNNTVVEAEWKKGQFHKEYRTNYNESNFKSQYTFYFKDEKREFTKIARVDESGNLFIKQSKDKSQIVYANGLMYEGQVDNFLDFKLHGLGVMYFQHALVFKGEFNKFRRLATGVFMDAQGECSHCSEHMISTLQHLCDQASFEKFKHRNIKIFKR